MKTLVTPGPLRGTVAAVAVSLALAGCSHAGSSRTSPDTPGASRQRDGFLAHVHEYMAVHTAARDTLPPLPAQPTAEQIDTRQRALARLIEQARPRASQGEVFTPDARAHIRTQLLRVLSGPDGPELRGSIMDENPGRIQLRINGRYPDSVPLSTMPYQVLAVLPPLPEELEYRVIGTRLILLDAHAHLVVDYMDDALPR